VTTVVPGPDFGAWARALCGAPTAGPADIARSIGLELSQTRRVGAQLICPPLAGTGQVELVLAADHRTVLFCEVTLPGGAPLAPFVAQFGPARPIPRGPHDEQTLVFERLWPAGAPRSCAVLVRLGRSAGLAGLVTSVTLYLQPAQVRTA
jgi:hypothetical protein